MKYLRNIKVFCICMLLLQFYLVSNISYEVSADGLGPEISNVYHTPKYPIYPDTITVYATVIDSDGVNEVQLSYCDEGACYESITMNWTGSGDVYWGNLSAEKTWQSGTVVGYNIFANDSLSNDNTTHKTYFFYVSDIEVETEMEQEIAYVGEEISLDGTALYNGNESAPVEYSNVSAKIIGTGIEKNTTTDVEGKFNIGLIFDDPGDFQINTTVTNRTLVGYDEITVSVVPLSISYVSEFVQMTSCYPNDEIWVNGTCRYNSGRAVANSDVVVKINETLFWEGETDSSGNYSILITVPGETGIFTVNVSVTKGSLTGFNETTISVTEIPIPDLVVLAEDITFVSNKTPPLKHDDVNITVTVHNLGTVNCTTVMMFIYDGVPILGNLIGSDIISLIHSGGENTSTITWNASNGIHDIWVVVDPLDEITESFEDNNNASKQIFVDNDFDGDGVGDLADVDDDNDGFDDAIDEFPYNSSEWSDLDGDGIGDNSDDDIDGDGVPNSNDSFPFNASEWLDSDGDEIGNNADDDDDNDGLLDSDEDKNGNGIVDPRETDPLNPDTDGDGVDDKKDFNPLNPKVKERPEAELSLLIILIWVLTIIIILIFALGTIKRRKP